MKAIKYPFTLDKFGVVNSTTDPGAIYLDRLVTLLSTHVGQRPVLRDYGTDFSTALFENENRFTPAVKAAVITAVQRWMPDVKLININVAGLNEFGIANVEVYIQIPDGTIVNTVVQSGIFKSDGTIASL